MANYYGIARSNYFAVKDVDAFLAEMAKYPVEVITQPLKDEEGNQVDTLYGFIDADDDGGANIWSYYEDAEDGSGDYQDIEWAEVFQRHLQDDWVAIIMESGSEKHRYVGGLSLAFNNKGEKREIYLSNITTLAEELGSHILPAHY